MLSINTDVNSIKIRNYMSGVTNNLNSCTKKLSTGQKLNEAKDDAAGLYLSEGIKTRINSYNIGIDAVNTALSILNIAEGSIQSIKNDVLRLRDLAVEGSNNYYTPDARQAMQDEANQRIAQMQMEKDGCNYNGKQLLAPSQNTQATQTATTTSTSATGFVQLTIDDFENVTETTLNDLAYFMSEEEWHDYYEPYTGMSYSEYVSYVNERTTNTAIKKGERNGNTYYLIENFQQLSASLDQVETNYMYKLLNSGNFVLLSDINCNGGWTYSYANSSNIDGNGHVISNLNGELTYFNDGNITNLGFENCNFEYSGIIGEYNEGTISNCYIKDSAFCENSHIFCNSNSGTISNCYAADCTFNFDEYSTGVICGYNSGTISNTFVLSSTPIDKDYAGYVSGGTINNNYQDYNDGDSYATYHESSWFASQEAADALGDAFEYIEGNDHPTLLCENPYVPPPPPPPTPPSGDKMRIQVGYDANDYSFIEIELGFDMGTINVDLSSAESSAASITEIDNLLKILNDREASIGAAYNRLETISDSNAMAVENMSSSRSTIVDADVAKVNSEYVKNQILQNASQSLLVQASHINAQIAYQLITGTRSI